MDATVIPRSPARLGYGNRPLGMYSTHAHFDACVDTLGKPLFFPAGGSDTLAHMRANERSARKGKQLSVPRVSGEFSPVTYKASPFDDSSTKVAGMKKALGFGTGRAFGRSDLSSALDTKRHVLALQMEERAARVAAEARGLDATGRSDGNSGDEMRATARRSQSASPRAGGAALGMSARLPACETQFDRTRHLEEFTPKARGSAYYDRDYGAAFLSSRVIGEGCADGALLSSPQYAKRDIAKSFTMGVHAVSPIIAGRPQ